MIVNKKISTSPSIEGELRNAIYFIKKHGVDDHMKHIGCNKSFYMEHLYGIAYFIHMVDKDKGKKYLKQLDELNR